MGNGHVSVKEAVETELAGIEDLSPELKCIKHLAGGFDNLQCSKHMERMNNFSRWKNRVTGALVLLGVLIGGGFIGILIAFFKGVF